MLALDLSRSMLADAVAPSRLARAKLLISALLDQLRGERVGLIVFSGTAFVQSPLSADYEVLRDFLAELDPSYLPQGGTDYEAMLRAAREAFGQQDAGDRYLVVLSDGEALDEHWQALVPSLRYAGIRVIGLGVGTPQCALLPDGHGGLVKDEHGAAVLSRLEPQTLQQLAEQTGGTYRAAAAWVDIAELVDATVAQGRQGRYVEQRAVRLQDHYQWFLAPGLFLLLLSYWFEFPLSPLARALPKRGRRAHPASAPVIASALMVLVAWQTHSAQAYAAVSDNPPQSDTAAQPNALAATVAELSDKPDLAARDYARLATDTVTFASQPNAPAENRTGIVDDALAAVDRGEATDPHAADWPALRAALEKLKQTKPQPPPQSQQGKDDKKQNQSGQAGSKDSSDHGAEQASAYHKDGSPGPAGGSPAAQDGKQGDTHGGAQSEGSEDKASQQGRAESGGSKDSADGTGQDSEHDKNPADAAQQESAQAAVGPPALPGQGDPSEQPKSADVKPLDAPEAGLAGSGEDPKKTEETNTAAAGEQKDSPPQRPTRMVGGGRVEPQTGDGALAGAFASLQQLKDGDSPAVLFDRMNRAEGQPRPKQHEKNW